MLVTVMACRMFKFVKEMYVVEASSFMDAERSIREEMDFQGIQIVIPAMQRAQFAEVCFNSDAEAYNFYRVRVVTEYDDETGRMKKKNIFHLVQAPDIDTARTIVTQEVYKDYPIEYEIADIVKTQVLDILEEGKHVSCPLLKG